MKRNTHLNVCTVSFYPQVMSMRSDGIAEVVLRLNDEILSINDQIIRHRWANKTSVPQSGAPAKSAKRDAWLDEVDSSSSSDDEHSNAHRSTSKSAAPAKKQRSKVTVDGGKGEGDVEGVVEGDGDDLKEQDDSSFGKYKSRTPAAKSKPPAPESKASAVKSKAPAAKTKAATAKENNKKKNKKKGESDDSDSDSSDSSDQSDEEVGNGLSPVPWPDAHEQTRNPRHPAWEMMLLSSAGRTPSTAKWFEQLDPVYVVDYRSNLVAAHAAFMHLDPYTFGFGTRPQAVFLMKHHHGWMVSLFEFVFFVLVILPIFYSHTTFVVFLCVLQRIKKTEGISPTAAYFSKNIELILSLMWEYQGLPRQRKDAQPFSQLCLVMGRPQFLEIERKGHRVKQYSQELSFLEVDEALDSNHVVQHDEVGNV
jgi:hypothetical protein